MPIIIDWNVSKDKTVEKKNKIAINKQNIPQ